MATVAQTGNGKGHRVWSLASANDETGIIPLTRDETCLIHLTGMSGSTVQILTYVGGNATGVATSFGGATSFTADTVLGFTAPGKCGITVKLTVDGGTVVVTVTK